MSAVYLEGNLHLLHMRHWARWPVTALHSHSAADHAAAIRLRLGSFDCVADDNRVCACVDWHWDLEPGHELLHDLIALCMNDQVSLLVLGSLLQIDNDKLPTCGSTAMSPAHSRHAQRLTPELLLC